MSAETSLEPDYPVDRTPVAERQDAKGRTHVALLTERELMEEIATTLRNITDGIEQMSEAAHKNPMMKGLLGL